MPYIALSSHILFAIDSRQMDCRLDSMENVVIPLIQRQFHFPNMNFATQGSNSFSESSKGCCDNRIRLRGLRGLRKIFLRGKEEASRLRRVITVSFSLVSGRSLVSSSIFYFSFPSPFLDPSAANAEPEWMKACFKILISKTIVYCRVLVWTKTERLRCQNKERDEAN